MSRPIRFADDLADLSVVGRSCNGCGAFGVVLNWDGYCDDCFPEYDGLDFDSDDH